MKPELLGYWMKQGWKKEQPLYLFRCPKHGYVANTPAGYDERLECPRCWEETKRGEM